MLGGAFHTRHIGRCLDGMFFVPPQRDKVMAAIGNPWRAGFVARGQANHAPAGPQIPVTNAPEWLRTVARRPFGLHHQQRQQVLARGVGIQFAVTLVDVDHYPFGVQPARVLAQVDGLDGLGQR